MQAFQASNIIFLTCYLLIRNISKVHKPLPRALIPSMPNNLAQPQRTIPKVPLRSASCSFEGVLYIRQLHTHVIAFSPFPSLFLRVFFPGKLKPFGIVPIMTNGEISCLFV